MHLRSETFPKFGLCHSLRGRNASWSPPQGKQGGPGRDRSVCCHHLLSVSCGSTSSVGGAGQPCLAPRVTAGKGDEACPISTPSGGGGNVFGRWTRCPFVCLSLARTHAHSQVGAHWMGLAGRRRGSGLRVL